MIVIEKKVEFNGKNRGKGGAYGKGHFQLENQIICTTCIVNNVVEKLVMKYMNASFHSIREKILLN